MIVNGIVMTGDGGRIAGWTLEITDGVITYLGSPVNYHVPEGTRVIDAAGNTVMPGVVDSYVHGTEYTAPDYAGMAVRRGFLLEGVTTTCNAGHSLSSSASFDEGPIINGVPIGRVYNSGPQLSTRLNTSPPDELSNRLYQVEPGELIPELLSGLKADGADFITIAVGQSLDPHSYELYGPVFSTDEVSELVIHAASLGLQLRAIVPDSAYMPRALLARAPVIAFVPPFRSLDSLLSGANRHPYIFAYSFQSQAQEAILEEARSLIMDMAASGTV